MYCKPNIVHTVYHNKAGLSTPGVRSRKKNVDSREISCYKKENIETDEAEITVRPDPTESYAKLEAWRISVHQMDR